MRPPQHPPEPSPKPFTVNIELQEHPIFEGISLTCKNVYIHRSDADKKKILYLYGVNFLEVPFIEIAALMKFVQNGIPVKVDFGKDSDIFSCFIKMVDTSAKQIKFEC